MPCITLWSYSPATTVSHWNRWACVFVHNLYIHCTFNKYSIISSYPSTVKLWISIVVCKLHLFPSQDMCVVCGSFGLGAEGRLLACAQCGQCYHPFCVGIKVSTPSFTVAFSLRSYWRLWYYIRVGNVRTPQMTGLRVNHLLISNILTWLWLTDSLCECQLD